MFRAVFLGYETLGTFFSSCCLSDFWSIRRDSFRAPFADFLKEKQLAEIQKELIVLRNKLAIPDAPGSSYTVKTGDTIHSIAKEFKVTAEALKKQNKVTDPTKLAIGRILVIPATTAPERIASTPSSPKKARRLRGFQRRYLLLHRPTPSHAP